MLQVAALIAATTIMAAVHVASLARPAFVLGAVAITLRARRRSPSLYLTATLWFWSMSPLARRLIDYFGGFSMSNIVLITPNILALFMVKDILQSRTLWRRPEAQIGLLVLVPAIYGLVVSWMRGDVLPGAIAATDWFTPLLYYLFLIDLGPRILEGEGHFRSFVTLNLLVFVPYGIWQYISPPEWDVQWVLDSHMTSVGLPVPYGLKAFSTINGPGIAAFWIASLLLLSIHYRSKLSALLIPGGVFLLVVTLVRAAIGGTLIGLAVACFIGREKFAKPVALMVVAVALAGAAIFTVDPRVAKSVVSRFESTQDIDNDPSARMRADIWRQSPEIANEHPLGVGIGAMGRGAEASGDTKFMIVDAGPLAIYLALGWVGGTIYLAAYLAVTLQGLVAAARSRSPAATAHAITALCGASLIVFVNPVGVVGVCMWFSAGYASAVGIAYRSGGRSALRSGAPFPERSHGAGGPAVRRVVR
jgi:O-antigen ligase